MANDKIRATDSPREAVPSLPSSNSDGAAISGKSTRDTSFDTWPRETEVASQASANKRKREEETVEGKPLKRCRESDESDASDQKGDESHESEESEKDGSLDPIGYWTVHHSWPEGMAQSAGVELDAGGGPASSSNKRSRVESGTDLRSYNQRVKDGEAKRQYTAAYEVELLTQGIDMDLLKGKELVSDASKTLCVQLEEIKRHTIEPTIFGAVGRLDRIVGTCQNRNEPIVNRDITPLIIPPIASMRQLEGSSIGNIIDEVGADWYENCVIHGPQMRPDLAIGLRASAFTEGELSKLKYYKSLDNWAQFTDYLYFPFLLLEVKCGRDGGGLPVADRQNMHSSSVALRALLRLEQEADRYRPVEQQRARSLSGRVLVFSISHDAQDVRVHGHFAVLHAEKWTYYRYSVATYHFFPNDAALLGAHNFVRNLLDTYPHTHLERIQNALAAMPEPRVMSHGIASTDLSNLSVAPDTLEGAAEDGQPDAQGVPDDVLMPPPARVRPARNARAGKGDQIGGAAFVKLQEQIDRLMQQLERADKLREEAEIRHREEKNEAEKRHREDKNEAEKRHREEVDRQKEDHRVLVDLLKRQLPA